MDSKKKKKEKILLTKYECIIFTKLKDIKTFV